MFIILVGCSSEEDARFIVNQNGDSVGVPLNATTQELQGISFGPKRTTGSINDICLLDSLLFIKNDKLFTYGDDKEAYVFWNIDRAKIGHRFLRVGEGPDEVYSPQLIKLINTNQESSSIDYFNFGNAGLYRIKPTNASQPQLLFQVPKKYSQIQSCVKINDSIFAFVGPLDMGEVIIANIFDSSEIVVPHKQPLNRELNREEAKRLAVADIGYNRAHNCLYYWSIDFNSIYLRHIDGSPFKTYSFGTNKNIQEDGYSSDYMYYYSLKSEGDFIYGLYVGISSVEGFLEEYIPLFKSELHLYNIRTDEVTRYKLDRLVNYCTIDFDQRLIYAVEEDNEDQPIVVYKMN